MLNIEFMPDMKAITKIAFVSRYFQAFLCVWLNALTGLNFSQCISECLVLVFADALAKAKRFVVHRITVTLFRSLVILPAIGLFLNGCSMLCPDGYGEDYECVEIEIPIP